MPSWVRAEMASPAEIHAPTLAPQLVAKTFAEQYYTLLHNSPESVYKFYLDSSNLSRPNANGVMTSVTTTQAIDNMVLSFDYKNYITEILTVDSQPSCCGGVFILVTGYFKGQGQIQRKFTQSFLLAAQNVGVYFVLNDMFRFVDETQPEELNKVLVDGSNNQASESPIVPDTELASKHDLYVVDPPTPAAEVVPDNIACNPSENEVSGEENEVSLDPPVHPTNSLLVSEAASSLAQVDVSKKSYASIVYASIVKVPKGSTPPKPVYVPTTKARSSHVNPKKSPTISTPPDPATEAPLASSNDASEAPATSSNGVSAKSDSLDVVGYSVHIRNLSTNVTAELVEEEFKKFGPIKPGGVQVRRHRIELTCFGFVEFESLKSMQAAIAASPIAIEGRPAYVAEKKTTTRVINGVVINSNLMGGRGRYGPPTRGGFQNDNFRNRGGFNGNQQGFSVNQGFGRSEFRPRGVFTGRGRGPPVRFEPTYQHRVFQNGYGRTGHRTEMKEAAVSA